MRPTGKILRVEIEMRARRLASAVIAAHAACDGRARARADGAEARELLAARVEDLVVMVMLLPQTHGLRLAAEHVAEVHARWDADPQAEALVMAVAVAFLERMAVETDTAFRVAA
jgi:hypothetical protein